MSTTTAVEDEWERRIGPEAARARRAWGRLRTWAWGAGSVTAALCGGAAVDITLKVRSGSHIDGGLLALTFLGILAAVVAILCGVLAAAFRFRMEAAALRALGGGGAEITAWEIGRNVRSAHRFDVWSRENGIGAPDLAPTSWASWAPDRHRPILWGPSAKTWSRAIPWALGAYGVLGMSVGIMGLAHLFGSVTMIAAFAGFVLCGAFGMVTAVGAVVRRRFEYRCGYVTWVMSTRAGGILDNRTGADLVDPKSGFVIRPACTPPLDRATYDARISQIRAAHPDAIPKRLG